MKKDAVHRYCGRDFSAEEMRWIARVAARREAGWTRKAISRVDCNTKLTHPKTQIAISAGLKKRLFHGISKCLHLS